MENNYHSCAGCGAKSWSQSGNCDYCGGNVKKMINGDIEHYDSHIKIMSGTNDPRSDSFKRYWIDCQMGVFIPNVHKWINVHDT